MWLFVGSGKNFEPVIGGRQQTQACKQCGQRTVFYEKRMTRRVSVYFLDVFAHSPQYVMACGACGAAYAVGVPDESFAQTQRGTVVGALSEAAGRAKALVERGDVAAEAQRVADNVSGAAQKVGASAAGWLKRRIDKG